MTIVDVKKMITLGLEINIAFTGTYTLSSDING